MKLVIGSVVIFSIVILFLFALFPSNISVTRIVEINCSKEKLMREMADLRTWPKWNLLLANTDTEISHGDSPANGIDSGFLNIGGVSVSLLFVGSDSLVTKWQHNGKIFLGNFHITAENGMAILVWRLDFHIKWYPWDKLSSMFYEKEIGPLMDQSLKKLQEDMEKP